MIEWYQLQGNKKLCCVLIIAMSNSSAKLTAGNIVELSISTFSHVSDGSLCAYTYSFTKRCRCIFYKQVMKTSVAFFNVLRKLAWTFFELQFGVGIYYNVWYFLLLCCFLLLFSKIIIFFVVKIKCCLCVCASALSN